MMQFELAARSCVAANDAAKLACSGFLFGEPVVTAAEPLD